MKSAAFFIGPAWFASVMCAFWLGYSRHQDSASHSLEPMAWEAAPRRVIAEGVDTTTLRRILREELKEELGKQAALLRDLSPIPALAQNEDAARADREDARINAVLTVDMGIADGVWSKYDVHALREKIHHLNAEESQQVLAPLFAAINEQRLILDAPPF